MKQTAIEIVENKVEAEAIALFDGELTFSEFMYNINKHFNRAKEMEKKRMIEFTNDYVLTQCNASFEGNVVSELSAEEYYELTFKSE